MFRQVALESEPDHHELAQATLPPVVATPLPWRSRDGTAVLIVTEVSGTALETAGGLELKAVALDMRGRLRASDGLAVRLETLPGGENRWVRLASNLRLAPGRWQLRIAARRLDGRAEGSAFLEVEVPDPSRELVLGGLVLATAGRAGVLGADRIPPEMPSVPVATRELPTGVEVRGALPLRVGSGHQSATVRVTRSLIGPDGTREDLGALERPAREFIDGGVVEAPLPVNLKSGPYRLHIAVAVGRVVASRELSFYVH